MMLELKSIKNNKLNSILIKKIINLKRQEWKHSFNKQKEWIKKYLKKDDIHNLFFFNKKLIGYTLLRKRQLVLTLKNKSTKKNFFYFDTLIVDKNFRKKKFLDKSYSNFMMSFNLKIINKHKYISILHCKNKMINFYKKYDWYNINKKIVISDNKKKLNLMIFNEKKLKFKKIFFYT
jgi:hypothetical protein